MSEDVKILVSTPGAKEAAADLGKVAASTETVGKAGQAASAGANADKAAKAAASQQTRELNDRNRTLAERLRALGPEFAVLGDAIDGATMKQGVQATMIGVLGAAILGVTMLYRKWSEAEQEKKQKARELLTDLKEQHAAYLDIAQSVEKARLAEENRNRKMTTEPPGELMHRVHRQQAEAGFGEEAAKTVGQSAAVAPGEKPFTDDELKYFGMWVTVFPERAEGTPLEVMYAFRAYMQQANAKETIEALFVKHFPEGRTANRTAGIKGAESTATGERAKAAAREVYDSLLNKEITTTPSQRHWYGTSRDWENSDEFLKDVFEEKKRPLESEEEMPSRAILEFIRRNFPEAARQIQQDYPFPDEETAARVGRAFSSPMTDESYNKTMRDYYGVSEKSTVINNNFSGTNYINMDKRDPAGVPIPSGM